jgi:predicted O-linked N-acetylglucosamine transferase (SPINDLY family)
MSPSEIQQAFSRALQQHQSGRMREAEQLYQQILSEQPAHAGALHYLGVLAHQQGRNDTAIDLISKAIAITPNLPEPHNNLGLALKAMGRSDDAIVSYKMALAQKPAYPGALYNLGIVLHEQKKSEEAIAALRRAIALRPEYAEAHNALGTALSAKGEFAQAIIAYRQAIAARANYAEAYNNLGAALKASGQLPEAVASYRLAIALNPNLAEAHSNLGIALVAQRQFAQAIAAFEQAIALDPRAPQSHFYLGNALGEERRLESAIAAFRRAIALKPHYPEALENLAKALRQNGQLEEAVAVCRQFVAIDPQSASAHVSLGIALKRIGHLDQAIAAYRTANALDPKSVESLMRLGAALKEIGELDEAIAVFRTALSVEPGNEVIRSNLIFTLHYPPHISPEAIAQEHRLWNQQHAQPLAHHIRYHTNDRDPDRRLRIGYVSPDLREHAVPHFLLPLLANHDHQRFEIFAYANVRVTDAMTQRLRSHTDNWRSVFGLTDADAADQIRQDQIDILIDLAGHTAGHRLVVFAHKPAPVQMTYLGYPDTTAMDAIDYRITDAYADPPGQTEQYHSEQLLRISPCAWCFAPNTDVPLAVRYRGPITFGCFNIFAKVTQPMLEIWSRILLAVPDSRLLLKSAGFNSAALREQVQHRMSKLGISPDRLELRGKEWSYDAHLALYGHMDIALDTFPYHGTTTTCEAMWMGVPVITLAGVAHVARVGVSLLTNVGLPELVATTADEYVQLAVALAADRDRLDRLHSTLRRQMEHSPLMNAPRFARNVEAAYRQTWRNWCQSPKLTMAD